MSITLSNIVTNIDTYIGDSSTDRISSAERIQAINEATVWLQEELGNEMQNNTYSLKYYDSVYYYKVSTAVADLLEGADLRRATEDHNRTFAHKSSKELAEEIGQNAQESSWAIERRDGDTYLVVNHQTKYTTKVICDCDATDSGGGTWSVDTTNSDATNLTIDTVECKTGTGSFNFDIDVSQAGTNKAELVNSTLNSLDLSDYEDLGSFLFWLYIPDVTEFTSVTIFFGEDESNYWSATVTTDVDGSAWANGWNRVKIDWEDATKTGSPDASDTVYFQIDLNYTASQGDDTDFRIDDIILVRPETLTFHYLSWNVGTNSGGTDLTAYTATTDIPYYSGMYDQLKYPVAHKAASILFNSLRLYQDSQFEEQEALKALRRIRKLIPSSRTPELKSFKAHGINFS